MALLTTPGAFVQAGRYGFVEVGVKNSVNGRALLAVALSFIILDLWQSIVQSN